MTSIPDLIDNWRKRRLDGDVSFGVLVDETIDLLTRLTTPGDEGLETTEEERADTSWPPVTGFVPRLLRDFDLLRAKLRAAEERADRYEVRIAQLEAAMFDKPDPTINETGPDVPAETLLDRVALDPEPKP
jgi:hypothetical protein